MNLFSVASFQKIIDIAGPLLVFFVTLLVGYIVRGILFRRLARWAEKTKSRVDDIVIDSIKSPFIIWCVMLGMYFALDISKIPDNFVHIAGKVLFSLGVFSVMIVLANMSGSMISVYSQKVGTALPVTSLTQNISKIIIFAIGILVVLNSLGVSITPILATLGVGGLAVALALQDTLSNIFSGFHIIMSRQVKIGDYVKLQTGEEGYVTDITWRTTTIRMLPNNIILVPNAKLTQAIITNYYLPETEMAVLVEVGVHYESDLTHVEKITCEVAKEVMQKIQGGVPSFDPFIRYHTFDDFSINFTVILRAKEFVDQYLVKHEFVKRLHARYAKEGIVIPYPIRAINYEQEKATAPAEK
jgi:small-conductance mechanosensitive channel